MPLFLSDEEFSRCSDNAALVAEKADAFISGLLNDLETIRAKADASDINAEQNCSLVEQKYVSLTAEYSKLEAHAAELQSALDQRLIELSEVQSQKPQIQSQFVEKDGEIERLRTEVGELHKSKRQLIELVEQKDMVISEKNATIKSYLDKIVSLSENAAQKEARLTEAEAELARFRAACTRLSEEKEIIERQNAWLNEELTAKVNSFFELQKKHNDLEADMSSKLLDVERQFSECSKSLQLNTDRVRELEMKLKSVQEELISAKDAAAANEEQFSAELSTVNKLNALYKESSEEWSRKAGELEGVIKAMESHRKQVEDDCKERLEEEVLAREHVEKEAADLKAKLEKCEAEIEMSKKTNELNLVPLSSFSTEPWSASIETNMVVDEDRLLVPKVPFGVSGTALAASLLRDGWSLAKMYAKYQEAVDALRHEQLGRKESEAVLQRVLYELEEKAEAIIDERVEHEKMAEAYSLMNQKLQNSLPEKANLEKTIQELKADLRRHERDYSLSQKEISDLQKQVTVLLKECRDIQLRCGSIGFDTVDDAAIITSRSSIDIENEAEKVMSEQLMTFKDINGLVQQNIQLRSIVRNLSDQIENKEMEFKEKLEMEMKKHTEEAASKVEAVLQRAEEQGHMIESLHTSVAMYKRLYEEEHSRQLSCSHDSEAPAEGGRNTLKPLLESSQETTKKSLEQAAEHVRCLEDDLAKSRSEIIVLGSERDKLALEANFARERLDNFMKEFEHQKAEANGILARNVEFSQLIVDYQRKLRESSESLHSTEELSRNQAMELSVLKHEKEVLSNAEKRASDEVRSLSERVHRLQASLDTIQSAEEVREEARAVERRKQEEYIKKLEREWAEAKKELQDERENVRIFTVDHDQTIKNYMRQVEELNKDLTNALRSVSAAESRAAVAEAKLSSLKTKMSSTDDKIVGMDGMSGPFTLSTDEVVAELQTAKEEIERLKEESDANKAHMLQYKSIAEVNENVLKQVELAHENFKIEVENTKKALEDELYLLREKVSMLENESSLRSEEVTLAAEGKQEALSSAMTEITNLKEQIFAKSSQISAMEVQISCLKEDLDKEHQRWRAAQTNYERQVILQSETIQELTKTSQALALLQEEMSKLRKLVDAQKIENNELKAKWEEEKAALERSKNHAEMKYDEINEQNKILHSRLEALHIQWAEKERSSAGLPSGSSSADTFGDTGLQNVINYLRRSKEIAETEISLLKQEKLRLQSRLESALKAAESAQASLEAERANSKLVLFTEEEFKSLQLQVREMNLLRESNMQLREENKHNFEECQKLREIMQKARSETENLENLMRDKEIELECRKNEIEELKVEKDDLSHKFSELLGRCKNVDVEDYNRMKTLVTDLENKLKEKDVRIDEIGKVLSEKQDSISHLEQDLSNCRLELTEREKKINDHLQVDAKLKADMEKQRKLLIQYKKRIEILSREKEDLVKENQQLSKQLDEIKQGKRLTSDGTGEQAMKEEKDTRTQDSISHLEQDLSNCRLELTEREKKINDHLQVEAKLKTDMEKQRKLLIQYKKRIEILSREKEDLVKENQQLSKQLDEIKQGKRLTSDGTGEQAMKEEKDTRTQILETHVARLRDELKKEKEDNRIERGRRMKTEKAIKDSYNNIEQEKTKLINELERHKEALKRLSDGVEKIKVVIGNLPEGTNVVQHLSGSNLDEFAAPYISAIETFEKEARLIFSELGGHGDPVNTTSVADTSAASTGTVVPVQSPSIISSGGPAASSLPLKATEESEKKVALPKANLEARKPGRRLVRPRLVKLEEPRGDTEMSEVEGSGGKPGPSSDTETQGNLTLSSQPLVRKRVAPTSTSQLREESATPGETSSDVAAPVSKKAKGSDSLQESAEVQPTTTLEFAGSQPVTEESFDAGELPEGLNDEVIEPQNEEGETSVEKDEGPQDPQNLNDTSQEENQGDKSSILKENLDQPVETNVASDGIQRDQGEPDNQQSTVELGGEKEEVELPEAADVEGGDVSNPMENQETREGQFELATTPELSPARMDDEALEAGEINSPELSTDDKNDEGDVVEEAADVSDKPRDVNDPIAAEADQVAVPAPVASESTSTSNAAAETASSKVGPSVTKQVTSTSVTAEPEDTKQASPASISTTINLSERARQRAQLRQAGVVPTPGRGRGRAVPRGRVGRVGRGRGAGRRQSPGEA